MAEQPPGVTGCMKADGYAIVSTGRGTAGGASVTCLARIIVDMELSKGSSRTTCETGTGKVQEDTNGTDS